jgi:hypothetical protein
MTNEKHNCIGQLCIAVTKNLRASEISVHGHLVLSLGACSEGEHRGSKYMGQRRLLTLWQPGSKDRRGQGLNMPSSRAHCQ